MATERQACGLGSFLPMSCRHRAEAFARRLQNRLRSLGNGDSPEETKELVGGTNGAYDAWRRDDHPVTSQPPERGTPKFSTSSDSDLYFDFDLEIDSPGSPVEIGKLPLNFCDEFHSQDSNPESGCVFSSPVSSCTPDLDNLASRHDEDLDSNSSDGLYFDPESSPGAFVVGAPWVRGFPEESSHEKKPERNGAAETDVERTAAPEDECECEVGKMAVKEESCVENGSCGTDVSTAEMEMLHELCEEILTKALSIASRKMESFETEISGSKEEEEEEEDDDSATVTEESPALATEGDDSEEGTDLCCSTLADKSSEDEGGPSLCETLDGEAETRRRDFLDVDDECPRVRRSSSLKTGKTPPGTPGRKKIVRFADVLGLDLADVRTFLDEIPSVPSSAFWDLRDADKDTLSGRADVSCTKTSPYVQRCLVPMFQQPGGSPNFIDRVRGNKVCLENAYQGDDLTVSGTVRVLNVDFNKTVHVRYTLDNWQSFADLQASYLPSSCDGFSDKFSFVLYCHTLDIGQKVEFALRFQAQGTQFWDNNSGQNYVFQCLTSAPTSYVPLDSPDDRWMAYF